MFNNQSSSAPVIGAHYFSPDHLAYFQRWSVDWARLEDASYNQTTAEPKNRRELDVNSIGLFKKEFVPTDKDSFRLLSQEVLSGLSQYACPVAYAINGTGNTIKLRLGTYAINATDSQYLNGRRQILHTLLKGVYPAIEVAEAPELKDNQPAGASMLDLGWCTQSGLVLGVPALKIPTLSDPALPLDRLLRSMYGLRYCVLILAQPVPVAELNRMMLNVLEESRTIAETQRGQQAPNPTLELYGQLLLQQIKSLLTAQSAGGWRTAVYLLGDTASYAQLASVWKSLYASPELISEPIKVILSPKAKVLAQRWALPDLSTVSGPGYYQRPFDYQTVLSSPQLAAYIHLPTVETAGFQVTTVANFDTVPAESKQPEQQVQVGYVIRQQVGTTGREQQRKDLDENKVPSIPFAVDKDLFSKHVFIAGTTGAGKTQTLLNLLEDANRLDIPFLVIEPAKTEYRDLLHTLKSNLNVFTLGNETVAPLRLNPFYFPPGISVGTHIDLLRSVFTASFGMWTPLPQILERCLQEIYTDNGWDLAYSTNPRLGQHTNHPLAYPTLSGLSAKVEQVIASLGYEDKVRDNLRAALNTRITSMRNGSKGLMFDGQPETDVIESLMKKPTVLELEHMGDDDDKAFLMGLIIIRVVEHWRTQGSSRKLKHLLVIEEAHRLLTNAGPVHQSGEETGGNPRGKAVEAFSGLMTEVRAYGQGIIVVDQVPTKLARDVIKNTNLKIVHRIVDAEDRILLGGAMAMNEGQAHSLATLHTREAVIFSEGEDAPLLVLSKFRAENSPTSDQAVRALMRATDDLGQPSVSQVEPAQVLERIRAKQLTEDSKIRDAFRRLFVRLLEVNTDAPDLLQDIRARFRSRLTTGENEEYLLPLLLHELSRHFGLHRGVQYQWTFADTARFMEKTEALAKALLSKPDYSVELRDYRRVVNELHLRVTDPYPACSLICKQTPSVCLYQYDNKKRFIQTEIDEFSKARAADRQDPYSEYSHVLSYLSEFAQHINGPGKSDDKELQAQCNRIGLCFAQQVFHDQYDFSIADTKDQVQELTKPFDNHG